MNDFPQVTFHRKLGKPREVSVDTLNDAWKFFFI